MNVDRSIPAFGLVNAVHQRLDAFGTWTSIVRDGGALGVWRVEMPDRVVYVKQHTLTRKRRQEVSALRDWTSRLAVARHRVPVLVAELPAFESVVMSAVAGTEAHRHAAIGEVWTAAGRVLRALHVLPQIDPEPRPVRDAVVGRAAAWYARADHLVPASTVAAVRQRVGEPDAFRTAVRVPCHRDFQPNNWLVHGGPHLGIVDWEDAALDVAEADLVHVAAAWLDRPDLRAAFIAGYGELSEVSEDRLGRLLALFGLANLVWGLEHGDPGVETFGRAILARTL